MDRIDDHFSKMRILDISLVARPDRFDAIHVHTYSLAGCLNSLGSKIVLVVGGDINGSFIHNAYQVMVSRFKTFSGNENFFTILYYFLFNNLSLFFSLVRKTDYDIIYERHSPGLYAGLLLSRIRRVPLIYEVNGIMDEELFIDFGIKNRLFKRMITGILKFQLARSSGVIVQTEELKKIIEKKFGIKDIYIVENGTEIRDAAFREDPEKIRLTYVGVLDKHHDLEDVFQAVLSVESDFEFKIIGDGNMLERYKKDYGKDNRIIFMGQLDHEKAMEFIEATDICIAAYGLRFPMFKKYGFYFCPLKILEYLSFGKPVIHYGLSNSFIRMIEDENGICSVQSIDALSAAIERLISDKNKRISMSRCAKEVSLRFTWDKAGKKTYRILRDTIEAYKK